ncbi:right-handed parallel beta-helix repeat-containing protein [Aurantivibrio plasticivorans]
MYLKKLGKQFVLLSMASLIASTAVAGKSEVSFDCDNPKGKTLGQVINKAKRGTTIKVSGLCQENIELRKRVNLDGQGIATITPADPSVSTVWVGGVRKAKISGFSIEAGEGSYGIIVTDDSFVTIENNTVTGGIYGIGAHGSSLVNIVGNTVSGATEYGINVGENAYARIGFQTDGPSNVVNGNVIQNNQQGILVLRAQATIVSNQILNNLGNGIVVLNDGTARVANNEIAGNNIGIVTISNGGVDLALPTSTTDIITQPNYGINNTLAVYCNSGFMSGTIGSTNFLPFSQFFPPCENQTTP